MKIFRKYSVFYTWFLAIFIVVPILMLVAFTFTNMDILNKSNIEFSTYAITSIIDPIYWNVILLSLKLAIFTTIITLLIGYPVAYIISKINSKYQSFVLILFILPMWMNMLLRTYAWKSILTTNGILNSMLNFVGINDINILNTETAVLIGMVYNFLPFMIFPIYNSLHKMDNGLISAAKDLGCNNFNVFKKIVLPLSMPGIGSGIILVLMPSATSFVIPAYLGGGKVELIGNLIERQFTQIGDWNIGSALSLILLTLLLSSTLVLNKGGKKYEE